MGDVLKSGKGAGKDVTNAENSNVPETVALHKETTSVLDLILMSSAILLRAFHKCVAEIATTVLMPGKRHVTFFG